MALTITSNSIRCKALVRIFPETDEGIPEEQREAWVDLRMPWDKVSYIYRHVWRGIEVGTALVDFDGNTIITNAPYDKMEVVFSQRMLDGHFSAN